MRTERQRDLAAVVDIVFQDVPNNPTARTGDERAIRALPRERLGEIGGRPAVEAPGDHRPCSLQALDELGGGARRCAVVVPAVERVERRVALAHPAPEPAEPRADDVGGEEPDRALPGGVAERQVLRRQRGDHLDQEALMLRPAPIEHGERIRRRHRCPFRPFLRRLWRDPPPMVAPKSELAWSIHPRWVALPRP